MFGVQEPMLKIMGVLPSPKAVGWQQKLQRVVVAVFTVLQVLLVLVPFLVRLTHSMLFV